ncbi:unnamed protein product [Ectocarpus sp. 8 AP-2014]
MGALDLLHDEPQKRQQGTCDWCRIRPLQMRTCRHHLRDLLAASAEGGMRAGQRAVIGGLPGKLTARLSKHRDVWSPTSDR